jgi:hypothetical protein
VPTMPRTLLRLTSSLGLALCLSFVFTPLGCGESYQGNVRVEPAHAAHEEPQVPPGTFSAMMACVMEAKGRLTDTMYAVQFDIEVTEGGEVGKVKLHDSYPSEQALEVCLGDALEGMSLPASVRRRLPKKAVSPASRGMTGQIWEELLLIGGATSLGPISLTAAGVTVIVFGGVLVTAKAIESVRRRRKRIERCTDMFVKCQDIRGVCARHLLKTLDVCGVCRSDCQVPKTYTFSECYDCGFDDLP